MRFYIIGIDDNPAPHFFPEVMDVIHTHRVFSGGMRHYKIVNRILPDPHTWIPVTVPLAAVFDRYRNLDEVVVFASGDPLFYGFANTILREMPQAEVKTFPFFHSLQLLSHRLSMPYHEMHTVSLTGRSWDKFDEALLLGYAQIGVLTDSRLHTPATIAGRMLAYGYEHYRMYVGELLGNEKESVTSWSLQDAAGEHFRCPNCVMICRTAVRNRPFGIPESEFLLLDGRPRMITKMPIRLLTLSRLDLRQRTVFWDIGFCTGSVSIEAKLQFTHLHIVAFEQREEGKALMTENAKRFGTPGIETVMGDFTLTDVSAYPAPDAVFIGGHGGKLQAVMAKIAPVLTEKGVVVFNSVTEESGQLFAREVAGLGWTLEPTIDITVDDFNTVEVMKAVKS